MNPPFLAGAVATFFRVLGSTVVGKHSAVLESVEGSVGGFGSFTEDEAGETGTDVEQYGALGMVVRPRAAAKVGSEELATEAYGLRTAKGLVPLARRDLRINRQFPAPKPGTVAVVGYGGGFLAFDDTPNKASSKATLYVPYGRSSDQATATKAMVIAIDPDQESMMLVHGEGYAVVLDKDNGITLRADASTWLAVKPGKIELVAASVQARGSVALGRDTTTAIPLLPGVASQPTPSVFFSPT